MNNVALVVDDDQDIRAYLRLILMKFEFSTVDTAGSGKQALQSLARGCYSHVFLDKSLPDTDGLVLLNEIRKFSPDVKVVMCTADGSRETITEAMQAGIAGYLVKPFSMQNISKTLARIGIRYFESA